MRRKIILLLAAAFLALRASSQSTPPQTPMLLSRAQFESGISMRYQTRVESQLSSLLTSGNSTYGASYAVFAVVPVVTMLDQGQIEGIDTRQTVRLNLQLRIVNQITGEVLHTADVSLTGAGNSLDAAIGKALDNIRNTNPAIKKALTEAQAKIQRYYADNCTAIQDAAQELLMAGKYSEALAQLHAVPRSAPCYNDVAAQKEILFEKVQEQQCENLLQKADAKTAANDFAAALNLLAQIDSQSPCAGTAQQRIAELEGKVDAAQKEQYQWLFQFWSAGAEAEKAHWNALSAFCLDWMRGNGKYPLAPR